MSFDLGDYNTVEQRILDFRDKHPDGSLSSRFLGVESTDAGQFVVVEAAAHRTPEDTHPGIGLAWCHVPGLTPYTRNSELQNAETAARGRAIVAVGASDAKASRDEIQHVRNEPPEPPEPVIDDDKRAVLEARVTDEGDDKLVEWWGKNHDKPVLVSTYEKVIAKLDEANPDGAPF